MYTLIEIFDSKQYENILSPLSLCGISKIIYVGSKEVMTAKKIEDLKNFFACRKYSVPMEFLYVERDNSNSVINRFTQIIKNNTNCIFDATGGDDVILASVGIICERYSLPIIRTSVNNGNHTLIHGNLDNIVINQPDITPDEFVILQGGNILRHSVVSHFSPSEIADIEKMFYVNSQDCESYSAFCTFAAEFVLDGGRLLCIPKSEFLKKSPLISRKIKFIINILCEHQLIKKVSDGAFMSYEIKSNAVALCIMKAGNVLEYYTALSMQNLGDIFSHIKVGTTIDWDDKSGYFETQNEIDVLATAHGVPVFISCKNGEVKKDALYELDAVSRALGGAYAKRILVCTHISKNISTREHFIKRAQDMKIGLVFDTHKLTQDRFLYFLKNSLNI